MFFAGTIIPILILQIYCWYKVITIEQYFGANFDACFNISKSLQSVDVINDQRPENRNIENDNIEFNENQDNNEKKLYQVNENHNNINPSQRSGNYMLEKPSN